MDADSQGGQSREDLARILGIGLDELDYLDEPVELSELGEIVLSETEETVSEIEEAAAKSRDRVVPNRISYGLFVKQAGWNEHGVLYTWLAEGCSRTAWVVPIPYSQINRWERAGWCRRPQTDLYDIRWKIYWRA